MALNFVVKTVPHKDQRYNTVGDYYHKDGVDHLIVTEDQDPVYEMAVALHELAEWSWARDHSVTDADIDAFDTMFEEEIKAGKHPEDAEPGDDPRCPVYAGHQMASALERTFIAAMGRDWQTYNKSLMDQVIARMKDEDGNAHS